MCIVIIQVQELFILMKNLPLKKINCGFEFLKLYQVTGNELCITAVNVNMIRVEYFHQKTTPDVPVKLALRMSISIPGKVSLAPVSNPIP